MLGLLLGLAGLFLAFAQALQQQGQALQGSAI
jgi:hypothetical protein